MEEKKSKIFIYEMIASAVCMLLALLDIKILYPGCVSGPGITNYLASAIVLFFVIFLVKSLMLLKKDKRVAIKGIIGSVIFLLTTMSVVFLVTLMMETCPPFFSNHPL